MADTKLPALPVKTSPSPNDKVYIVDVEDQTDDPTGSSKQATIGDLPHYFAKLPNGTIPSTQTGNSALYYRADGHLIFRDENGGEIDITTLAATVPQGTTTTPPATAPGNVVPPPPSTGTPPAADPVNFTQGNNTLTSPNSDLADFNAASPTSVGSESVTTLTANLTAPTAPTVAAGSAGNPNGVYKCQVTFVTASGETNGGTEATITVASKQISWSAIPLGPTGTTARKLYRTPAGGASGSEKLVTTISDNTTTTYTDNVADGSLSTAVPTANTSAGNGNPFLTGKCFKYTVVNTTNIELGLDKDLSRTNTRDFKFNFALDGSATLSGEQTIFQAWTDNYAANLVQIRIAPDPSNGAKYNFLIRTPGTNNYASQMKKSTIQYTKGIGYSCELHMSDTSFELLVNGVPIIELYNGSDLTGAYYAINNTGLYIGGVSIGKFYSQSLGGIFYYQNINFYQDYVQPTGPTTAAGKLADAWAGWKKRYLRSDGAIVRPYGEGVNGIYQVWSDVVSEGIGYALLMAVQMNDQATFDLVEGWAEAHLVRSLNSMTAAHLLGWHWDDINNTMYDWNFATDADMDRAMALIWAAHRKANGDNGWVTSALNYSSLATNVVADLKTYAFRTDSSNGYKYLASDSFQLSADPMEINLSYHAVACFPIFKVFTGDTFWDNALLGSYDIINKSSVATLTDQGLTGASMVGVGLVPDWVGYSVTSHNAVTPPNNRQIKFSYDAFRTNHRVYWHYFFTANAAAKTFLTGDLRTFYLNQWTTKGTIYAEYNHDGTVYGAYEKSMMTFGAYFTLLANSPSDTTAIAIFNAKLSNLYTRSIAGGFYKDNATPAGSPSYFNNSWLLFSMMIYQNSFVNF